MIALVFGDEKKAKVKPRRARIAMRRESEKRFEGVWWRVEKLESEAHRGQTPPPTRQETEHG